MSHKKEEVFAKTFIAKKRIVVFKFSVRLPLAPKIRGVPKIRGGRVHVTRKHGSGLRPRLKSACELTGVEPVRRAPAKLLVRSIHMEKWVIGKARQFFGSREFHLSWQVYTMGTR